MAHPGRPLSENMQAALAVMPAIMDRYESGESASRIADALGLCSTTVMRAVRRIIPEAFRVKLEPAPHNDNDSGVTHKIMPHQVGWSTDPVSHHAVSLPRLRFLEAAA